MVLDLKSISARLDKLREYLALLKEAQKMSLSVFKKDPRNYYTVERALQLAIECCHDIGNHLISELLPDGRFSNSDPITGQAAWFDLRVSIEKANTPGTEPVFEPVSDSALPEAPDTIAYGAEFRGMKS